MDNENRIIYKIFTNEDDECDCPICQLMSEDIEEVEDELEPEDIIIEDSDE